MTVKKHNKKEHLPKTKKNIRENSTGISDNSHKPTK